jgi:hypothetical protein
MAAGAFVLYGEAKEGILKGLIDLDGGTIVTTLHTSSYTPAAGTHATWADVSATEVSGSGYTAGGQSIAPLTVVNSAGTVTVDSATNPSWTTSTITAKYAVLALRAGGSLVSGDLLVGYVDLDTGGGSVSTTAGTLSITWNASGIFTAA